MALRTSPFKNSSFRCRPIAANAAGAAASNVADKPKPHRTNPTSNDLVWLNVGGQNFLVRRSTLFRVPHSRLYRVACNDFSVATGIISSEGQRLSIDNDLMSLATNNSQLDASATCDCSCRHRSRVNGNDDVPKIVYNAPHLRKPRVCIYFDRDPEIFRYILDYYRNGELHIPHSLCGPNIRKELIFWGVSEADIQVCCLNNYMRYEEESLMKNLLFKDFVEDLAPMKNLVQISCGWRQKRYQIWLFLDYPTSSMSAKCWALVQVIFIILSILFYCARTHPQFRTTRKSFDGAPLHVARPVLFNVSADNSSSLLASTGTSEAAYCASRQDARHTQKYITMCTEPVGWLLVCDIVLMIHFACDALCKLLVAPDRMRYCKRVLVLIELVIQISFWTMISIELDLHINDEDYFWPMNVTNVLQALRIARILKVAKLSDGLRVLILTLKRSITELLLLAFLMVNGMFLFACMIYMAEYEVTVTFPSIPSAFWWAIITLTGVGYGDVTPTSPLGFFVGGLAAVCGAMVTGLAIPIIGHNFNTYYKYMKNQLKESEYLKQKGEKLEHHNLGIFDKVKLNRVRTISLLPIPSIRVEYEDLPFAKPKDMQEAAAIVAAPVVSARESDSKLSLKSGLDRLKLDIKKRVLAGKDGSSSAASSREKSSDQSASRASSKDERTSPKERADKSISFVSPNKSSNQSRECAKQSTEEQRRTGRKNGSSNPPSFVKTDSTSSIVTVQLTSQNGIIRPQPEMPSESQSDDVSNTYSPRGSIYSSTAEDRNLQVSTTRTERLIVFNPKFHDSENADKVYDTDSLADGDPLLSTATFITTPITRID